MWYVYILESASHPSKFYTGFTSDLKRRLAEHNAENNKGHTTKYKPWKLHTYIAFINKQTAQNFEEYLKTSDDPKWEKIASAGRKFALQNFNNDKAVNELADLFSELK